MALGFGTAEWCERATELLGTARATVPIVDATIGFSCPTTSAQWVIRIADGAIASVTNGSAADADLVVSIDARQWLTSLLGTTDGSAELAAVHVADKVGGPWQPPSPMDLGWDGADDVLPLVPGADVDVQYDYHRGPFGPVTFSIQFRDGRIDSLSLNPLDDPDVRATCSYLQMAQVRRGDLDIFGVLTNGGTVSGDEGPLALLGGISESPEFRAVERACGPSGLVLAAWAEVVASEGMAAAAEQLNADTAIGDG